MLEDLEREYTREDDWCGGQETQPISETEMLQMINRHQDQKESFLKACTMARRSTENFMKYLKKCNGQSPQLSAMAEQPRGPEAYTKSKLCREVYNSHLVCIKHNVRALWSSG